MGDFINTVLSAPVANLLIIAGLVFLAIAVVGKIIGKIDPGKVGRIIAGIVGAVILVTGLLMHLDRDKPPTDTGPATAEDSTGPATSETQPPQVPDSALPELFVSEFYIDPQEPVQGKPINVRIGIYNKGQKKAGPFTVQWWAGENFPKPAKEWEIDSMTARGGKILTFKYHGYNSWYSQLTTKVVIDPKEQIEEKNKQNNTFTANLRVVKK